MPYALAIRAHDHILVCLIVELRTQKGTLTLT